MVTSILDLLTHQEVFDALNDEGVGSSIIYFCDNLNDCKYEIPNMLLSNIPSELLINRTFRELTNNEIFIKIFENKKSSEILYNILTNNVAYECLTNVNCGELLSNNNAYEFFKDIGFVNFLLKEESKILKNPKILDLLEDINVRNVLLDSVASNILKNPKVLDVLKDENFADDDFSYYLTELFSAIQNRNSDQIKQSLELLNRYARISSLTLEVAKDYHETQCPKQPGNSTCKFIKRILEREQKKNNM